MIVKNFTTKVMDEEKQLAAAVLKGKKKALYLFYQRYQPATLRFIKRKVGSDADAEEILQDTLLAVLEGLADFAYRCRLETYVLAIAKRKIADFYRRRTLKTLIFSRLPGIEQYVCLLKNPEKIYEDKILAGQLERVFAQLRPRYQQLLRLKYIEKFSLKQIAAKFKQSLKAVESSLFRARQSFVKLYEQEEQINFERPEDTAPA